MKCFHHTDGDGLCSGAIVKKFYGDKYEYIKYDYKDFPYDSIEKDEEIILVDCSCDFYKLLEITNNITWIDHHLSVIKEYEHLKLQGLRVDGTAACELCWRYFYPSIKTPYAVELLGDYDVWKFAHGEATNYFQTAFYLNDHSLNSKIWDEWLNPGYFPMEELEQGKIALQYRNNYYKGLIKSLSFFAEFEGYKAICCNAGSVSSQLFDSVKEEYDIMIPFSWDGEQWKCSVYTTKDIDVSKIARKYGGNGHLQAAGFRCKELPFKKLSSKDD
jgi:oligoribonuclease NrnB/cAMP/cGMP phosphodiesterase (DHH superfamily)